MRKLRILHVIDKLEIGGAQTILRNLVTNKLSKDIEFLICVIANSKNEIYLDESKIIRLNRNKYDFLSFWNIYLIAKHNDVDIVHLHLMKSVIMGLIASLFGKWKVVVHHHGTYKKILCTTFLIIFKSRIDLLIAVSRYIRNELIKQAHIPPSMIRIIYNNINLKDFKSDFNRNEIRTKLGIQHHEVVLGCLGRLVEKKGFRYLIQAIKELSEIDRPLVLLAIGEGKLKNSLIKMSRNLGQNRRAVFLGFQKDVPELVSAFDIAIIPSIYEPFGIISLEFMAMKIPIIASNVGGLSELIHHEINGLLVPSRSVEALSIAIHRLIADSFLKNTLTSNAHEFVKNFDTDVILPQIITLYRQLTCSSN